MRVLAGEDDQFEGHLQLSPGIRVSHLQQEPPLSDGLTVEENIRPALQRIQDMLEDFEQVGVAARESGVSGLSNP